MDVTDGALISKSIASTAQLGKEIIFLYQIWCGLISNNILKGKN